MNINKTVYLKNYQKPCFRVQDITLDFDIHETHVTVKNTMNIVSITNINNKNIQQLDEYVFYGDELELISISINNQLLTTDQYEVNSEGLMLRHCPQQFQLEIVTRIYPQKNTQLSGLYRSNNLYCTQCEAEGFRRITYYPDRPDVLSVFTTRITADKTQFPILLSNGNRVGQGMLDDGRHWVEWHDPFKKPCYLFALVAGNLAQVSDQFTTCSGRNVALDFYVEPGNEHRCAHAMASLKHAMRWDEEQYGREYDLDSYMVVAVSDFNMGAMENKGLNIFNAKFVLASADTATDQDYANIESVVAHEYFHNWTGNRVTCRDWFQLSLKEGLTVFRDQEFSRDMNSRDVCRIGDVRRLRSVQFPEDASSMAHPVQPKSYEEINNFYTPTVYEKGAEVIRMQHTLLGKTGFRKGMDLYFERHDGQAVTIDDFVAAMADANHTDLTAFKQWYHQVGTPHLEVQETYSVENQTLTLTFQQKLNLINHASDAVVEPLVIPIKIALFQASGEEISLDPAQALFVLNQPQDSLCISNLAEKPIVSLLREFSAPVILKRDLRPDEWLSIMRVETDGVAQWDAAMTAVTNCLSHCYHLPREKWHIDQGLLDNFSEIMQLDDKNDRAVMDYALRSELLIPPSYEEIVSVLPGQIDVVLLEEVRDFYYEQLSNALVFSAKDHYKNLWLHEDHSTHGKAYGRRQFRNLCLSLWMKADEEKALSICQAQMERAQLMTDQLAAFQLLVNSSDQQMRFWAIDSFYQQWQNEPLVLDKWFEKQALSSAPDTLNHVQSLLSHSAFQWTNPNKVRALIGTFCMLNHRHFHAVDGSGYAFLTEMLLKVDAINGQVAARLAKPLTQSGSLDKARQIMMFDQLQILAKKPLSNDLGEIINKSISIFSK